MSAGGLSYSGLTNYGKITLPSAESWGTNMNILRDPPKSIMTRKIDKVGENSSITEMIDDSSNRACEAIQVYARGVNPSVSVSYGNGQNMGGNLTGISGGGGQAKLPYRIMNAGAFRPPIWRQEDLLPLSRQHRSSTSAFTQPGFVDFSRKLRTCGTAENTKEVYTKKLVASVRPTAVYRIDKPQSKPSQTKNAVKSTIINSVNSGLRSMDITKQHVGVPINEINQNPMHAQATSNIGDITRVVPNKNIMETDRYIQDSHTIDMKVNTSSNIGNHTSIEDIFDTSVMPIKDITAIDYITSKSRDGDGTTYIHEPLVKDRNIPCHVASTNKADTNTHKRILHENDINFERNIPMSNFEANHVNMGNSYEGSRNAQLTPKISVNGNLSSNASKPSFGRIQQEITMGVDSEKVRMNKHVSESMFNKFSVGMAPFQ